MLSSGAQVPALPGQYPYTGIKIGFLRVVFSEKWEFTSHDFLPLGTHSLYVELAETSLSLKAMPEQQSQTLQDVPFMKRHIIKRLRHSQYKKTISDPLRHFEGLVLKHYLNPT